MSFENLPNEIVIECFECLSAFEIFYSFDNLNSRFQTLIRCIRLNADFRYIDQSKFDDCCEIIYSNRDMQQQIHLLQLSDENFSQIRLFLSTLSLLKFSNLRSLTLIEMKQLDRSRLLPLLPVLSQLSCIRLTKCKNETYQILPSMKTTKLRILTVPHLFFKDELLFNVSSLRYLTLLSCDSKKLHLILDNALQLKYLNIKYVNRYSSFRNIIGENSIQIQQATKLKQLILNKYLDTLPNLESIFKRTPNLESLSISIMNIEMLDANQWQTWIMNYLPKLKTFRFHFHFREKNLMNTIQETFEQFQNDFWQKQHQWFTEYMVLEYSGSIYSLPYFLDSFVLEKILSKYEYPLTDDSNKYDSVKHLKIGNNPWDGRNQLYFSNIGSLEFSRQSSFDLHCLMKSIDLTGIKELIFKVEDEIKSSFLFDLFKQAPNISSLSIYVQMLIPLFRHDELCSYLKKTINQLNFIESRLGFIRELRIICELLTKLSINSRLCNPNLLEDFLIFLIESLPKLIRIEIPPANDLTRRFDTLGFVKQVAQKLNLLAAVDNNYGERTQNPMIIWISR